MLRIDIICHLCYNAKVTVGGYAPQPLTSDEYNLLYSSTKGLAMAKHSVLTEKKTNLLGLFKVAMLSLIPLSLVLGTFLSFGESAPKPLIPERVYGVSGTVESVGSVVIGNGEKSFVSSAGIVFTRGTQTYTCASTTCAEEVKSGDFVHLQCSQDVNQMMVDCSVLDVRRKQPSGSTSQ